MEFSIAGWRAWAPGLAGLDDWQGWSRAPVMLEDAGQLPDVGFLPAMQRRRLSRMARMLFYVGWPLLDAQESLPLVFVSRHGETPRTLAMLQDVARGEPLSPTAFSLSVHNAPAGLWSMLGAEIDGLEHGIIDACGCLQDGVPSVLVVIAEETPAPLYQAQIDDVPFSYALALRLVPGRQWRLQLTTGDGPRRQWPHALELVRALCLGHTDLIHYWKQRQWNWICQTG